MIPILREDDQERVMIECPKDAEKIQVSGQNFGSHPISNAPLETLLTRSASWQDSAVGCAKDCFDTQNGDILTYDETKKKCSCWKDFNPQDEALPYKCISPENKITPDMIVMHKDLQFTQVLPQCAAEGYAFCGPDISTRQCMPDPEKRDLCVYNDPHDVCNYDDAKDKDGKNEGCNLNGWIPCKTS